MSLKQELISLAHAVKNARPDSHFYNYYSDRLKKTQAVYTAKEGECSPPGQCFVNGHCEAHG